VPHSVIDPNNDDIAVQFTIRQMTIGIAVLGVVLVLAARLPGPLIAGLDAVLIAFGIYKLALALGLGKRESDDEPPRPPVWFRIAVAISLSILVLGVLIGWLYPDNPR
jgi:hypothetical protein